MRLGDMDLWDLIFNIISITHFLYDDEEEVISVTF